MTMLERVAAIKGRLAAQCPLVHQITNYVTANDCANVTLAVGASPVMAGDIREAAEMVAHAKALVINIGTLQSNMVDSMFIAARRAGELSIPVVFDPVGVGATSFRYAMAERFIREIRPAVIRCNRAELKTLAGLEANGSGVDSLENGGGIGEALRRVVAVTGGVVAVTGAVDYVASPAGVTAVHNGDAKLKKITGSGCMTTALTAAYAAVGDTTAAAVAGVLTMGIAGELAAASLRGSEGIGSFKARLFDSIERLAESDLSRYAHIEEVDINGEY